MVNVHSENASLNSGDKLTAFIDAELIKDYLDFFMKLNWPGLSELTLVWFLSDFDVN